MRWLAAVACAVALLVLSPQQPEECVGSCVEKVLPLLTSEPGAEAGLYGGGAKYVAL